MKLVNELFTLLTEYSICESDNMDHCYTQAVNVTCNLWLLGTLAPEGTKIYFLLMTNVVCNVYIFNKCYCVSINFVETVAETAVGQFHCF
jgi:hypothetical protein